MISLLISFVCPIGCARTRPAITSLWQQVPPVRWPGRETSVEDPKPEPSVAANVALRKEGETDFAGVASVEGKSKSISIPFGMKRSAQEPRNDDLPGNIHFGDASETDSPFSDLDPTNSPLDRLNAALSDDVRQSLPQQSVTMLEERVRVDSLISRARELLDLGQYDQARDAALAAMEIGESAQLEYSPDEDRPIDLVRRIEGQQEAIQVAQESATRKAAAAVSLPHDLDADGAAISQVESADKDSKEMSRKQRGWSNLFRREKKPNSPPSANSVTQAANEVTPKRQTPSSNWPATGRTNHADTHDAVVMANRSVSLGSLDNSSEFERTLARPSELVRPDRDSANAPIAAPIMPVIADNEDDRSSQSFSESHNPPPTDDSSTSLPDLEAEEIASAPRHDTSSIHDEMPIEALEDDDSSRQVDGIPLYVAISLVVGSAIAIYWYRRGAT